MTQAVQLRKGTTAEHTSFTGLQAEATVDTTKKTLVVHDGSTAGGIPLSREDLSNSNPSNLTSIAGADTASGDFFVVYDVSASAFKKITRAELNNAMEQDALASVAITGGTINNTAIGGSTAAAGSFTTLTTSSTVTLNGGTANGVLYLNGSKVATSGSALTFDGTKLTVSATSGELGLLTATGVSNYLSVKGDTGGTTIWSGIGTDTGIAWLGSVSNHPVSFRQNNSEAMRLTSTGLKSSIAGTNADPVFSYTSDTNTGIFFPAADKLGFTAGGGTDQMVLTTTGLGIGTSSPAGKLDIRGSNTILRIGSDTNDIGTIQFFNTTGSTTNASIAGNLEGGNAGGNLTFSTKLLAGSLTERMRLDSSGNLGLGVTPSAWGSTYRIAFQVGSGASLAGAVGSPSYFSLMGNAFLNNSAQYNYIDTAVGANRFEASAGEFRWFTAGAGSNPISFSQAMTLDASGNLLVGKTSPAWSTSGRGLIEVNGSSSFFYGATINGTQTAYFGGTSSVAEVATVTNIPLAFLTNNTERARITGGGDFRVRGAGTAGSTDAFQVSGSAPADAARIDSSGYLLVGATSLLSNSRIWSQGDFTAINGIGMNSTAASGTAAFAYFLYNGSGVGSITSTGSATAYNTSSDYRLKDNQQPLTGSGAFIDALKPKTWNWKADGSRGVGFIAHEVQEVSPGSVVGTKDAVDEEGKPIMQAMEYGSAEFIANIIAELQSLRQRVALLEGN